MKKNLTTLNRVAEPQSFITKGKHRLKQHTNNVYLENGDEFEIELHNPTTKKVLAKISLNGNSIGSGIILRPGERIFLERHLNEPKKFKFETYYVDETSENLNAIQNNGDIIVEYFNEILPSQTTYTNFIYPFTYTTYTYGSDITFTNTSTNFNISKTTTDLNYNLTNSSNTLETGRIEKGSNSNQNFVYDNSTFDNMSSHQNFWKILPKSIKPLTKDDLKSYCTECGAKRKKDTFKFCPHCGNKF